MKMKKIIALFLALLTIFSLVACTEPEDPEENDGINYKITVVDAFGAPVSGMVVTINKDGEKVEMKLTSKEGKVEAAEPLESGSYTVSVTDPKGNSICYDEAAAVLSEGKEEITITLYTSTDDMQAEEVYLGDGDPRPAVILTDGGYRVNLTAGQNYFIFYPQARGKYSVKASSSLGITMGYHGGPYAVQAHDLASTDGAGEVYHIDGGICFNVRSSNVGDGYQSSSKYVLMVEADGAGYGYLTISCDPNLALSPSELPWREYAAPVGLEKYTVAGKEAEGFALTNIDVTSDNTTIVYNSEDKLYHVGSADGPVLLVRMTSASQYLAAFSTIMEDAPFWAYVYDDAGELIEKRNYHAMMQAYADAADEDLGVLPLNAEIMQAINDFGTANGWFDLSNTSSIFGEDKPRVNAELMRYFACCYVAD